MLLTTIDRQVLEKLFQMKGGYVLDFSDRTMKEFFYDDMRIQIYDEKYNYASGSKANRIRGYFRESNDSKIAHVIRGLIDYIENKIAIGDFTTEKFPSDRIELGKKVAKKLLGNNSVDFYNSSNGDLTGKNEFQYEKNNGLYAIGTNKNLFRITFTGAGSHSIYVGNEDISIDCLAKVDDFFDFEKIESGIIYDGTSRHRIHFRGEIILLKNTNGRYAAIKINHINLGKHGDVNNSVTFDHIIFPKDKKFKIAGERKIETNAYVDEDSINITINKDVFGHVKSLLDSGHYSNAVEESYKIVRNLLCTKTGEEQAHKAFSKENILKIFTENPKNDAEEDFREGVKFIHMAVQKLRNERAHTPAQEVDKNLALHYIVLAGLAYDLIK